MFVITFITLNTILLLTTRRTFDELDQTKDILIIANITHLNGCTSREKVPFIFRYHCKL